MLTFVSMASDYDCGVTAVANLIAYLADSDAQPIRANMTGQPSWWPAADFYDSPTRLAGHLQKLTGQIVGTLPAHDLMPCLVLVRTGWITWHWVAVFGMQASGKLFWHNGKSAWLGPLPTGWKISCCLAIGSTGKWPWWWQLWGKLVDWM
jgi:hypothetical protein